MKNNQMTVSAAVESIVESAAVAMPSWREEQLENGAVAAQITTPVVVESVETQKEVPMIEKKKATRKSKAAIPAAITLSLIDGKVVAKAADGTEITVTLGEDVAVVCLSKAKATIGGYKKTVATLQETLSETSRQLADATARLEKARKLWVAEHKPVQAGEKSFSRTVVRVGCQGCGHTLTDAVAKYSVKHFGQPLCMTCQKKTLAEQKAVEETVASESSGF